MPDTPFICMCVDGQTDVRVLNIAFDDLFWQVLGDNYVFETRYAHKKNETKSLGDLFSSACSFNSGGQFNSRTQSGEEKSHFETALKNYIFKSLSDGESIMTLQNVTHIIHIIDLDGVYCDKVSYFTPEEEALADSIIVNNKVKNTLYYPDHIAVRDDGNNRIESILDRNKRKRRIIEYYKNKDYITLGRREVGYSLYYFSTNLDHFLYGIQNASTEEKWNGAADYSNTVFSSAEDMMDFFEKHPGKCTSDYDSSWLGLQKDFKSLKPITNVNLLINKIKNSTAEDWL